MITIALALNLDSVAFDDPLPWSIFAVIVIINSWFMYKFL